MTTITTWDDLPRYVPSKKDKLKHIWGPFLPERCAVLIYGAKGSAKSPFVKALCAAISRGETFLGIPTRRRRVLYWDRENPAGVLERQNRHMNLGLGEKNSRFLLWTYFGDMPSPTLYVKPNETLENVAKEIQDKTGRSLLIVLDHWQQFLKSDASGLEPGETKPLIRNLKRLLKAGATVLIIGHPTVNNRKHYGFGPEDIDVNIRWMKEGAFTKMTIERSRYGETGELAIKPVIEYKKGKPIYRGFRLVKDALATEAKVEKMCEIISQNPNANQRELGELGAKVFKEARDTVIAFIKQHDGHEWHSVKGLRRKITYQLRSAGPTRFPRE